MLDLSFAREIGLKALALNSREAAWLDEAVKRERRERTAKIDRLMREETAA